MGACGSHSALTPEERRAKSQANAKNRSVDAALKSDHERDSKVTKMLLLGAGESGKSTLFKQIQTIYGDGFTDEERKEYKAVVHNNLILAMKSLCYQSSQLGFMVHPNNERAREEFDHVFTGEEVVDEEIARKIAGLWGDPGIQHTYNNRAKYQLMDSAAYFFSRVHEAARRDYLPTFTDILRCRVRTTGIVENKFAIEGHNFRIYDVGGQRNERKKWIHCFENVTALIFVAAISEFDQVLYEDDETNRLYEAFQLFKGICNADWFAKTSIILFLNKSDLFAEKIQRVKLSDYFPDYTGTNTYDDAASWIAEQFEALNEHPQKRIYTRITCATDTDNMLAVFDFVKDILIRSSLGQAGLV